MKTLRKKSIFWDVVKPDPLKNEKFIINRILNLGDLDDFHWLMKFYGSEKIKNSLLAGLTLDPKSLFFWCQYFELNKSKCISKQSKIKQSAFWRR